jgi:hypothetical protein
MVTRDSNGGDPTPAVPLPILNPFSLAVDHSRSTCLKIVCSKHLTPFVLTESLPTHTSLESKL